MKLREFLEELSKTTNEYIWFDRAGRIRAIHKYQPREDMYSLDSYNLFCPITAVAKNKLNISFKAGEFTLAGLELGLRAQTINRIANGADDKLFYSRMSNILRSTLTRK